MNKLILPILLCSSLSATVFGSINPIQKSDLRSPDYYDVTCINGSAYTCVNFTNRLDILSSTWICNPTARDFKILNIFTKKASPASSKRQFKSLKLADRLIGSKLCK